MSDGKGSKGGSSKSHGGASAHDGAREVKANPKQASSNLLADVWHKTTNSLAKHIEKYTKPTPSGHKKEVSLTRYLGDKVKEGQHAVKEFIGRAAKPVHAEANVHKLPQKERAARKISESDDTRTGRHYKYNDSGHTESVRAKNGSTLKIEYADGDTSGKVKGYTVLDKNGNLIGGNEAKKNVSIRFDDKSGTLIEERKHLQENADSTRAKEATVIETHFTPEGLSSVIERDASGRRKEKRILDSERKLTARTIYKYEKQPGRSESGGVREAVVALQFDSTDELRHQHVFDNHAEMEKQKASYRMDRHLKVENGVHSERVERYDLKKDLHNPVSRSLKESDFNVGNITVKHEQLENGKVAAAQTSVFDEMGRPSSFSYRNIADAQEFSVSFDRNGRPKAITGETGALGQKGAYELAVTGSFGTIRDEKISPMDHGELLAVRGPSAARPGESSSGTLVYKDGDRFVSRKVIDGIIYGPNKEKLGTVKDNGEVTLGGSTFNILSDKERAAAFSGTGSDGLYLDLTAGQELQGGGKEGTKGGGFNGYIDNGQTRMLTLGGHIFDKGSFFGQVDKNGKMAFNSELAQAEKDGTDISHVLKGCRFVGKEDGYERRFSLDRTSSGEVFLPKGFGGGSGEAPELRLGMIIDRRTNKQLANLEAPTLNADGSFTGGAIIFGDNRVNLNEVEGLVFKAKVDGESRTMQGAVVGKAERQADGSLRPNSSMVINLDNYAELSTANFKEKTKDFKGAEEHQERTQLLEKFSSASPALGVYTEYRKNEDYSADAKETAFHLSARQFHSDMSTIQKLLATGQADEQELQKLKSNHENYTNGKLTAAERLEKIVNNPEHELERVPEGASGVGLIKRPVPGKLGEVEELELQGKLFYRKGSKHPVGSIDFATGKVRWTGDDSIESLNAPALRGTVFSYSYSDRDGKNRNINWVNDGQGGLLSTDSLRKQVAQERAYAEILGRGSKDENLLNMRKRTEELESRYNKMLKAVEGSGIRDAFLPESGFSTLEMLRRGPRDFVRAEHNKDGRHYRGQSVAVPTMTTPEQVSKANGLLRLGNEHYYADHGKLYRAELKADEGGKQQWTRPNGESARPCGMLRPGYKAEIFGRGLIDLQSDRNFLFKMQVDGEAGEHWLMGLGAPRKDAAGNLVGGGLIDAKEVYRRNRDARNTIEFAGKQYKDEETWLVLGGMVDRSLGGRESQLDGISESASGSDRLMHKQIRQLFEEGLQANTLATSDALHNTDSIQMRMRELNLAAVDANDLSAQGRSYQSGVREGTAMVVTTALSGGTSLLVSAGRLTLTQGALVTLAGGGLTSAAVRQTRGGDWRQFAQNAGAGGLETTLMLATGGLSKTSSSLSALGKGAETVEALADARYLPKLQKLAQEGNLVGNLEKLAELQAQGQLSKVSTRALAELADNPQALKLAGLLSRGGVESQAVRAACDLMGNKGTSSIVNSLVHGGPEAFSKLGLIGTGCNAMVQTLGFNVIGAGKPGAEVDLNLKTFVTNNAEGAAWTLAGDFLGNLTHTRMGPRFLDQSRRTLTRGEQLVDTMISSYAENIINNTTNSALMALSEARKVERENIAREMNMDVRDVDDKLYEERKNEARINAFIFDRALEGAATSFFTHPVTHTLTHGMSTRLENTAHTQRQEALKAEQQQFIEDKINRLSTEAGANTQIIKLPTGAETVIMRDKAGEPTRISRSDMKDSELVREKQGWVLRSNGKDEPLPEVGVSSAGQVILSHGNGATTKLESDGRRVLRSPDGDTEIIHTSGASKNIIYDADGRVAELKVSLPKKVDGGPFSDAKFHRDASGQLTRVEVFEGGEYRKESEGWSLYYNDRLMKKAEFANLEIERDGTVRTTTNTGAETTTKIDGSKLVLMEGQPILIRDCKGHETFVERDEAGSPYKLILDRETSLVKEEDGWYLRAAGLEPVKMAQEMEVLKDGTIRQIDEFGVAVSNSLDGKRHVYVPGDATAPPNIHEERLRLETTLRALDDPLTAGRIEEDLLELNFKLKGQGADGDEKFARVLYEVNRLLEVPGNVPLERRIRWIDESTSLAVRPELLSQGSNPTCGLSAAEQREYHLHPETMFRILRRLHETGLVVGENGGTINYAEGGRLTVEPDADALAHYLPGVVRADGKRLEVSQIVQTAMMEVIKRQHPGRDASVYADDLESMMKFLNGRDENFVIKSPKDPTELINKLAEMKARGALYAVIEMDGAHIGARGMIEDGGHARIVKDIRSGTADMYRLDGLAVKEAIGPDGTRTLVPDAERIEIVFGNTWTKSASHEVLTADQAYRTTLLGHSQEHLDHLRERVRAGSENTFEKAELLAWKASLLNAVLKKEIKGADSSLAKTALTNVTGEESMDVQNLSLELSLLEKQLLDDLYRRRSLSQNESEARLLRLQVEDMLTGGRINDGELMELGVPHKERDFLKSLVGVGKALKQMENLETRIREGRLDPPDSPIAPAPLVVSTPTNRALAAMRDAAKSNDKSDAGSSAEELARSRNANIAVGELDMLTGFRNFNGMKSWVEKAGEDPANRFHLIYVDIRHFKDANNWIGVEGADRALQLLTRHMSQIAAVQEHELMSRPGGDEIVLALDSSRSEAEVKAIVEKLSQVRLACRKNDPEARLAGNPRYGMRLFESADAVDNTGVLTDLIVYPAIGAVRRREGERPDSVIHRADDLMNYLKALQKHKSEAATAPVLDGEGHRLKEAAETVKPEGYQPDYQAKKPLPSHGHADELPSLSQLKSKYTSSEADLQTLEQYVHASAEQRLQLRKALNDEVKELLLAENSVPIDEVLSRKSLEATFSRLDGMPEKDVELEFLKIRQEKNNFEALDESGQRIYLENKFYSDKLWRNIQSGAVGRERLNEEIVRLGTLTEENSLQGKKPDSFWLLQADLDNLKHINDKEGHTAGDALIQHAGQYLRALLPADCFLSHPGGGGFYITATSKESYERAVNILESYGQKNSGSHSDMAGLPADLLSPEKSVPLPRNGPGEENLAFGFSIGSTEVKARRNEWVKPERFLDDLGEELLGIRNYRLLRGNAAPESLRKVADSIKSLVGAEEIDALIDVYYELRQNKGKPLSNLSRAADATERRFFELLEEKARQANKDDERARRTFMSEVFKNLDQVTTSAKELREQQQLRKPREAKTGNAEGNDSRAVDKDRAPDKGFVQKLAAHDIAYDVYLEDLKHQKPQRLPGHTPAQENAPLSFLPTREFPGILPENTSLGKAKVVEAFTLNPHLKRNPELSGDSYLSMIEARDSLSVNFANLPEKGLTALLKVHLLLSENPHLRDANMKAFADHVDQAITDKIMEEYDGHFTPAKALRFAKFLEDGINSYARQQAPESPLEITVVPVPDTVLKAGELMAYRPGAGEILVRYSDLANPGLLQTFALFHEYIHSDQDRAKFRLAALTCLRRDGKVDIGGLADEYCKQSGQGRIDPLSLGFAARELKNAAKWLEQRRNLSEEDLAKDPDCIRARRLMESSRNPQPISTDHVKAQVDAIVAADPFSMPPAEFLQKLSDNAEMQNLFFRSPILDETFKTIDSNLLARLRRAGNLEEVLFSATADGVLNERVRTRLQCKYLLEALSGTREPDLFNDSFKDKFEKMLVDTFAEAVKHKKRIDFRNYVHDQRELEANYAGQLFEKATGTSSPPSRAARPELRHLNELIREVRRTFPSNEAAREEFLFALEANRGKDESDDTENASDALTNLLASMHAQREASAHSKSQEDPDDGGHTISPEWEGQEAPELDLLQTVGLQENPPVDWRALERNLADIDDPQTKAKFQAILPSLQSDNSMEAMEAARRWHAYLEAMRLHRRRDMGI